MTDLACRTVISISISVIALTITSAASGVATALFALATLALGIARAQRHAFACRERARQVLARDVLQLQTVAKPALLRHLFALAAAFPAQILAYNKMLGQLQDAGNTTTLAHYLRLLETAFLVSGLELYSRGQQRKRGSSPKLVLWNQALINALAPRRMDDARADGCCPARDASHHPEGVRVVLER